MNSSQQTLMLQNFEIPKVSQNIILFSTNGNVQINCRSCPLPPASEEWGKVIVSVCLSVPTWGVPQSQVLSWGGPQSQVISQVSGPMSFPRGYPSPDRGYPRTGPRLVLGYPVRTGVPPPPVRTGVPPTPAETGVSPNRLHCGRYASYGFPRKTILLMRDVDAELVVSGSVNIFPE